MYQGFLPNFVHHCLICPECRHIVDPEKPADHIRQKHKHLKIAKTFNADLAASIPFYSTLLAKPPHPTAPIPPIFGLCTPIPGYRICDTCHHGYKNTGSSRSFDTHRCHSSQTHPDSVSPTRTYQEGYVQTFTKGNQLVWFQVEAPATTPPQPANTWSNYQKDMISRPHQVVGESLTDNHRVAHQFLHKERWPAHIEGRSPKDLVALVKPDPEHAKLPQLHRHIHAYLDQGQKTLDSHYLRRLIGMRPSYVLLDHPSLQSASELILSLGLSSCSLVCYLFLS